MNITITVKMHKKEALLPVREVFKITRVLRMVKSIPLLLNALNILECQIRLATERLKNKSGIRKGKRGRNGKRIQS